MGLREARKLRRHYNKFAERKEPQHGILGNGAGKVQVGGRPNYCYVRIRGIPIVVYNNRTAYISSTPVLVGYDDLQPRLLQVLSLYTTGSNDFPSNYNVAPHHERHEFGNPAGGDDVVWVHIRQFLPLRVDARGMGITIQPHYILTSTGWVKVGTGSVIDLTPYVPVSGAAYLLVSVAKDGTITYKMGSTKFDPALLTVEDIPVPDAGDYPLASVRLYTGQNVISENQLNSDIIDLRWSIISSASQSSLEIFGRLENEFDLVMCRHAVGG